MHLIIENRIYLLVRKYVHVMALYSVIVKNIRLFIKKIMALDTNKNLPPKSLYTRIRNIPLELYPLGVVLLVGIGAACYNLGNKLFYDPSLRRYPSKKPSH
ncbi:hypothetical protein PORY_002331 [Pneumocystis oryctolagi]|uniref:Uncharacterized protein n=1 Tax=Pneumocystis oryctolagi TaxID=42067 RepID=A0ACB7C9U5_9ASCO|nr:hypothetical protein PORY_002331 [Pneumocystis oryctolagi]